MWVFGWDGDITGKVEPRAKPGGPSSADDSVVARWRGDPPWSAAAPEN